MPLKLVTIANGTPGEDAFRSTVTRHHQRLAHRPKRTDGTNAPERLPRLLRPTQHTARAPTVSATALAARLRTFGEDRVVHRTSHRSVGGTGTGTKASASEATSASASSKETRATNVHHRAPHVAPATFADATPTTGAGRTTKGSRLRKPVRHRSRRRVIRITMPSKKRLRQRVQGGVKVRGAIQRLDKNGLTSVLAQNQLVKPNTTAPESLLRHIATGVFA